MTPPLLVVAVVRSDRDRTRAAALGLDAVILAEPPTGSNAVLQAVDGTGARAVRLMSSGRANILQDRSIADLARFAAAAEADKAAFGFAGALEPPDVPRLRALRPHFLCLDLAANSDREIAVLAALCRLNAPPPPDAERDRLFIRDLDMDLEIGAYASERGRTQRVRFTVEAQAARSRDAAASMGSVYSYDLLMDAVAIAASGGHTDFVETLAGDIATRVLLDPRVVEVLVRVEKLQLGPRSAGIELSRRRN